MTLDQTATTLITKPEPHHTRPATAPNGTFLLDLEAIKLR